MLIDVTVKVDDTRVTDLYAAIIRDDLTKPQEDLEPKRELNLQPEPEREPEPEPAEEEESNPSAPWWSSSLLPWTDADLPLATAIWHRIQPGPQKVFSILLSEPGKKFDSEELIARTNMAGGHAFGAAFTWPGRFCRDAGRQAFWERHYGQYWIEPAVAAIFAKARAAANNG